MVLETFRVQLPGAPKVAKLVKKRLFRVETEALMGAHINDKTRNNAKYQGVLNKIAFNSKILYQNEKKANAGDLNEQERGKSV